MFLEGPMLILGLPVLPVLWRSLEASGAPMGFADAAVHLQCAHNFPLTEAAFVGKAPGAYFMLLGGGHYSQQLKKIY